jgi:dihydrofolate synthase / folylpolyglutamate synthase
LTYTDLIKEARNSLVTIRTIQEANQALQPYVPLVSQLTGGNTTLERVIPLMKLLGNPQDKLRVIHIAGTSGKTSTAYFLAALLTIGGKKTGLTVSPHVDTVAERVQINGSPLSESKFCDYLGEFLDIIETAEQKPSYFELLYAFSLWVFLREQVEYAVIETGMGGLYDATNVITRPDKICIITDIGYDHMHILGSTLPEIATQKIGIVHERNVVFCYQQSSEIMRVFQDWCDTHHAELNVTTKPQEQSGADADFSGIPDYQVRNWLLAYKAYNFLETRDKVKHLTRKELTQTLQVQVPGRMDVIKLHGKTVVMDGAHNAQKMQTFIESFKKLYPNVRPVVVIAMKESKDYQPVTELLSTIAERLFVTTFRTSQDLPARAMDPNTLAQSFEDKLPVEVIPDSSDAVRAALAAPESVVVLTGSFYLLSQIRNNNVLV